MTTEPPSITLHTRWRHLLGSAFGAVFLTAGGTYGVATVGFNPMTTILFVFGWISLAVVSFDVPVAATFSAEGVRRRTPLRTQFLRWQPGDALTRGRPSLVRREGTVRQGGLVLWRGKRRYMLVEQVESRDEHAAVIRIVDTEGTPGALVDLSGAVSPPEDAAPTWLYRRRRWRPDDAPDR